MRATTIHVNTLPPAVVVSHVVAPAEPVRLQATVPVGEGAPGLGFTVAVMVNESPRLGDAGIEVNVIVGVCGPSVTLAVELLVATGR